MRERQDCAFILFLHGSQMKGSFLREMDGVHNAMISVYVDQDMPEACQALRTPGCCMPYISGIPKRTKSRS